GTYASSAPIVYVIGDLIVRNCTISPTKAKATSRAPIRFRGCRDQAKSPTAMNVEPTPAPAKSHQDWAHQGGDGPHPSTSSAAVTWKIRAALKMTARATRSRRLIRWLR